MSPPSMHNDYLDPDNFLPDAEGGDYKELKNSLKEATDTIKNLRDNNASLAEWCKHYAKKASDAEANLTQLNTRCDELSSLYENQCARATSAEAELEELRDGQPLIDPMNAMKLLAKERDELLADNAALRAETGKLRLLLIRANKWVRMIDDRREEVPQWLRHDADPHRLRADINAALAGGKEASK